MQQCPNCGAHLQDGIRICLYCGQPIRQPSTPRYSVATPFQEYQKSASVFSNNKAWIIIIFIVISLILSILSLFLSWYHVRVHIIEIEGDEIDATFHMEDKLGEREEYMDIEYLWVDKEETKTKDNSELKHEYPDTARCKNITLALVITHIFLLVMALIVIFISFFKPNLKISMSSKVISLVLLFSFIVIAYFTFAYGPYEGDEEDDEEDELDIEYEGSGNWFYSEARFSGDMVGEGDSGVGGGYILFMGNIMFLLFSLLTAISLKKDFARKAMFPADNQFQNPPRIQYRPPQNYQQFPHQPPPATRPPLSYQYFPPPGPSQPYFPPPAPPPEPPDNEREYNEESTPSETEKGTPLEAEYLD